MKKLLTLLLVFLCPLITRASDIDEFINKKVEPVTKAVTDIIFFNVNVTDDIKVPFILLWLVFGANFFTIYTGFVNFRKIGLAIGTVAGTYSKASDAGEVSHFQALATALSGTVGLGNIAGVAIAISIGGPGATFWMIVAGLLGMSTKFVECTLGVKYRNVDANGVVHGGPMHYLEKGFSLRGLGWLGKFLAIFFAIMCVGGSFGGGNMFQANQAFKQFAAVTPALTTPGWVFGLFMAILVAVVIIGGIKSIARVTEKVVPFMCLLYLLCAVIIIAVNYHHIPAAFAAIFKGAFMPDAAVGGLVGVMIQGFKRAAFSNEAGIGSASIAHSAVKTEYPASEGIVALLEPFIDTVVICTMTALVIIISGTYLNFTGDTSTFAGVSLTSMAFSTVISWFPYILTLIVFLFAYSTMLSWSYYGMQSWEYIFGTSKPAEYSYKFIFCIVVIIGAASDLSSVVDFSDAMIFAMCFPNLIGMYVMRKEVMDELRRYLEMVQNFKK